MGPRREKNSLVSSQGEADGKSDGMVKQLWWKPGSINPLLSQEPDSVWIQTVQIGNSVPTIPVKYLFPMFPFFFFFFIDPKNFLYLLWHVGLNYSQCFLK